MKLKKFFSIKNLYSLTSRIFIFFNVFIFILTLLYLLGNFQNFQDSTQVFILKMLEYTVLITGILGAYYIALALISSIKQQRSFILRIVFISIAIILDFALFLILKFMFLWFKL